MIDCEGFETGMLEQIMKDKKEIRMKNSEVVKLIGKENIEDFYKFMKGQTIGFKNGQVDFYECDVKKFMRIKGMKRCDEG